MATWLRRPKTEAQLRRKVQLLWAERFSLPPSDDRFCSLTLKEAIDDIIAMNALVELRKSPTESIDPHQPILTGDPEWDRMELAEWADWTSDPSKDL